MKFASCTILLRLCLFSVGGIIGGGFAGAAGLPSPKGILVYYSDDDGASSTALKSQWSNFNQLSADTYVVDAHGAVSGTTFTHDLAFARAKGIWTFATMSNYAGGDFNTVVGHSIIGSSKYTQAFIVAALKVLATGHYRGLNIDFESILPEDRAIFTAFVKTVSQRLHSAGYFVVLSAPAEVSDDPSDSWSGAFDYPALGKIIDLLQLMTYDENGPWGDPGPVAGLDWMTQSVRYAVSMMPAAKVSLGIPAYGYDWDLKDNTQSTSIAWNQIPGLLAQSRAVAKWNAVASSPYFNYTTGGHAHVVWYENPASLRQKMGLVTSYHLAGISIWALGMEDASFWQAVHSAGF